MKRIICILIIVTYIFGGLPMGVFKTLNRDVYASADLPVITQDYIDSILPVTKSGGHPYLFGRADDFDRIKSVCLASDGYISEQYSKIKSEAAGYIGVAPVPITNDISQSSYISRGFNAWNIVMICSFVYLIEGDESYAKRAWQEADYLCSMDSWGTYQYIDNNQTAFAVALCYDWLYNYLNDTQKQTLTNAIKSKHFDDVYDLFQNPAKDEYKWTLHQMWYSGSNHGVLDNTSLFVQALAFSDVYENSSYLMAQALKNLEVPFANIGNEGSWYEGCGYWSFVGPFVARMMSAMDSAFGSSLGYEKVDRIKNLGYFPVYMQTDIGSFVFSDNGDTPIKSAEIMYFGNLLGDNTLVDYIKNEATVYSPLICLWYDENNTSSVPVTKDKLFTGVDVALMRSGFDRNDIFTGFAVQKPSLSGSYQSAGSIILDAMGERWISNPGRESYSLPSYWDGNDINDVRWKYYNTRAEANSCLVINPDELGGQNIDSTAVIEGLYSSDDEAYTYADLTDSYADDVVSYKRGLKLFDNRRKVALKDEAVLKAPSEVYSYINIYEADIELLPGGKSAILTKNGKKMLVNAECDKDFTFTVTDAKRSWNYTPTNGVAEKDYTKTFKRLTFKLDSVSDFKLSVVFTPYWDDRFAPVPTVGIDDISKWGAAPKLIKDIPISDDSTLYTGNMNPISGDKCDYGAAVCGNDKELFVVSGLSTNRAYGIFKVPLEEITSELNQGRSIEKIEFIINAKSGAGKHNLDTNIKFYNVPDTWYEDNITINGWELNKLNPQITFDTYDVNVPGSYYGKISGEPVISVPASFPASKDFKPYRYDITEFYNSVYSDGVSSEEYMSFLMAFDDIDKYWYEYIASSENDNVYIRPKIRVTFTDSEDAPSHGYSKIPGMEFVPGYTAYGEVTADSYISGGSSGDIHWNSVLGNKLYVNVKEHSSYSMMAYYRIRMPEIPHNMYVSSVKLNTKAYRQSDNVQAEKFELFKITDNWEENTLCYNNAPVRHTYPADGNEWYPFKKRNSDGSYIAANADLRLTHLFKNNVPKKLSTSNNYYSEEEFDITALYNGEDEFSFAMGIPFYESSDGAQIYIASKETPNEKNIPTVKVELKPRLYLASIALSSKDCLPDSITDSYMLSKGDTLCMNLSVANNSDEVQPAKLTVAAYNADGELTGVSTSDEMISANSVKDVFISGFATDTATTYIKCFVFSEDLSPLGYKAITLN